MKRRCFKTLCAVTFAVVALKGVEASAEDLIFLSCDHSLTWAFKYEKPFLRNPKITKYSSYSGWVDWCSGDTSQLTVDGKFATCKTLDPGFDLSLVGDRLFYPVNLGEHRFEQLKQNGVSRYRFVEAEIEQLDFLIGAYSSTDYSFAIPATENPSTLEAALEAAYDYTLKNVRFTASHQRDCDFK